MVLEVRRCTFQWDGISNFKIYFKNIYTKNNFKIFNKPTNIDINVVE